MWIAHVLGMERRACRIFEMFMSLVSPVHLVVLFGEMCARQSRIPRSVLLDEDLKNPRPVLIPGSESSGGVG